MMSHTCFIGGGWYPSGAVADIAAAVVGLAVTANELYRQKLTSSAQTTAILRRLQVRLVARSALAKKAMATPLLHLGVVRGTQNQQDGP
jgi:hypothetical protein